MERWRKVWREGIAPQLSTMGLEALRKALKDDDPRLIQGKTCFPPPLSCVHDRPLDAACGITYCGWQGGEGVATVKEATEYFARIYDDVRLRVREVAAVRYFTNWFDETPRLEMRRLLLAEISHTLAVRDNKEIDNTTKREEGTHDLGTGVCSYLAVK